MAFPLKAISSVFLYFFFFFKKKYVEAPKRIDIYQRKRISGFCPVKCSLEKFLCISPKTMQLTLGQWIRNGRYELMERRVSNAELSVMFCLLGRNEMPGPELRTHKIGICFLVWAVESIYALEFTIIVQNFKGKCK